MNKAVVTNLRMEPNDYLQAREMSSEMGISLNEYFNYLSRENVKNVIFGRAKSRSKVKKNFLEALRELAGKKSDGEGMGLSEEDEIIYED